MEIKRQDSEPPVAIDKWGWRFDHIGVPVKGIGVAMIIDIGAPIELLEFKKSL